MSVDHVVYFLVAGVTLSPRHVSLFLVYFSTNDSNTFGHPSPFCFHTFSLCLVFLFTSFFGSLFLCECECGFSFWPFFIPPSMFSVLISHSFRSTPISFSGPWQFILCSLELLFSVLQFLFALPDHVFLCSPFGPSCSYFVFIPQRYLLFGTL